MYLLLFCTVNQQMILNIEIQQQTNTCEILNCITKTALTYLRNLAGTNYELREDDAVVSKHVGAVQYSVN